MEQQYNLKQRNAGFYAFFISGICAISSGIIVSLLQEQIGFDYGTTGTLLALMNIGNLLAGFATGALPGKIGMKKTVVLLTAGYGIGYGIMGITGWVPALMAAFFLAGMGKGSTINTCTILIEKFQRQNKRNESDAQLLCIWSAALPISDFSGGCCLRKASYACSGNAWSDLVDGVCAHSYGRKQKGREAENRLELSEK